MNNKVPSIVFAPEFTPCPTKLRWYPAMPSMSEILNSSFRAALIAPLRPRLARPLAVGIGVALAGMASNSARAAVFTHANATTNFENTASWVGSAVPGSADTALFDSTSDASHTTMTYNSSSNLTLGAFQIINPGAAVVFSIASGKTFTFGATAGGTTIDMSAATQDFTIQGSGFFRFNTASQTWNVAAGRTLTVSATWSTQGNSKTLTLTGSGNVIISSNVSGGANPLGLDITGANVTLSGSNNWNLNNSSSTVFRLSSGTLNFGNNNALNSNSNGTSYGLNGGTITASGTARTITTGGAFLVGGNFAIADNAGGAQALTFGSAVTLSGDRTITNNSTQGVTFGGGMGLTNGSTAHTLTLNGGGATLVNSVIANNGTTYNQTTASTGSATTGNLTYSGSGTLTLSASNTYSGATTLTSGTVIANDNSAFGTSTITFNGGTLVAGGTAGAFTNNVGFTSASGLVGVIGGANTVTLSGTVTPNSNTLTVNNSGSTTIAGPVNLSSSSTAQTLTLNGASNLTIDGAIANGSTATSGNLTYSGGGVLTLTASNTFSGTTTVSSGTLKIANANALQNSTLAVPASSAFVIGSGITAATFGGLTGSNSWTFSAARALSPRTEPARSR